MRKFPQPLTMIKLNLRQNLAESQKNERVKELNQGFAKKLVRGNIHC